jgi:hypothetical protein
MEPAARSHEESLPALAIGDRVRSTARPDWGAGRVATAPAGGKVCVLFREAGPRTLSLSHAKLERLAAEERTDAWLGLLSLEPVAPDPPFVSPRQAAERFLATYPDGFLDADFRSRERAPLEAAQAILRGSLSRDALRSAARSRRWDPVCRAACEALSLAKLVPPADATLLRRALEKGPARGRFGAALVDLFYGRHAPESRVERFAAALEGIGACRWPLATFFGFVRSPEQHAFLRPGETPLAAAALRYDIAFRPEVNAGTYARLLGLSRALGAELAELAPSDAFDVHAFLRSVAACAPR